MAVEASAAAAVRMRAAVQVPAAQVVVAAAFTEEAGAEDRVQAVPVEVVQEEAAAATAKNKLARSGTTAPPGHLPSMFIVLTSTSTPPGAS
jgi:hypothetical protein